MGVTVILVKIVQCRQGCLLIAPAPTTGSYHSSPSSMQRLCHKAVTEHSHPACWHALTYGDLLQMGTKTFHENTEGLIMGIDP